MRDPDATCETCPWWGSGNDEAKRERAIEGHRVASQRLDAAIARLEKRPTKTGATEVRRAARDLAAEGALFPAYMYEKRCHATPALGITGRHSWCAAHPANVKLRVQAEERWRMEARAMHGSAANR